MKFRVSESAIPVFFKVIAWLLLLAGITIRVIVYLQDRNLFLDEANVARNISERSFLALATPLDYGQYAPPVFLWLTKLSSILFGYSEYVLRLLPLLSAIGALAVMYRLARHITSVRAFWYPLGLMAVAFIMIRYASELKQYMTDVLVILTLLLLAIEINIEERTRKQFYTIWIGAGTLAIWSAMPSVFALAGIGVYYFIAALKSKDRKAITTIIITGIIWLLQFAIYYYLILKPQINSSYLQNYHQDYFLYPIPKSAAHVIHNWELMKVLFHEAAGYSMYYTNINGALLFIGIVALLIKDIARAALLLIPMLALMVAASLHQYSLIPRVALFAMPFYLLFIGYGFSVFMNMRWRIIPLIFLVAGIKGIYEHSVMQKLVKQPLTVNEMTPALHFLKENGISAKNTYIHHAAVPTFIYYTQIHPQKSKWVPLRDANLLSWDVDHSKLVQEDETIALLITSISEEEYAGIDQKMKASAAELSSYNKDGAIATIYKRKQ